VLAGPDFAVDLRYVRFFPSNSVPNQLSLTSLLLFQRVGACVLLASQKSKLKVIIYRTQAWLTAPIQPLYNLENEVPSATASVKNRKSSNKVTWHDSDMDDALKAQVAGYAQALLPKLKADASPALTVDAKLAQALKVQLSFVHGNTWHAIASTSRDLCCLPYCEPNTFADFSVDGMRVVVYRHNGVALDRRVDMTLFAYRALLTVSIICFVVYWFLAYQTTELHTRCGEVQDESLTLPEGCSEEDVASASRHNKIKAGAFFGMIGFTIAASSVRLYRRALRMQLKHG
jgi:hypothetical protein